MLAPWGIFFFNHVSATLDLSHRSQYTAILYIYVKVEKRGPKAPVMNDYQQRGNLIIHTLKYHAVALEDV